MSVVNFTRIGRVRKRMEEGGIGQIVVTSPVSIYYLTGEMVHPGERCLALYIDLGGNTVLIVNRLHEYIRLEGAKVVFYSDKDDPVKILSNEVKPGKLGVDKEWQARFLIRLMELRPDVSPVNGSVFVDMTRMVKDEDEIEKLRLSSRMNDRVIKKSVEAIDEGLSEADLAAKVNEFFAAEGASVHSLCIVAYGKYCAVPHHGPSKDVFLRPGDNVLFDIGKSLGGYYSDMTRTVFYKRAGELQRKIYDIVLRANLAAIEAVRPGARACDVDAAARNVIAKAGYGEYFTHRTGHNIGIEVHEWPDISSTNEMPLLKGMCFSIEPGIYLPGSVGVRIEDLVVVTENGCEVLNRYTKEPQIVG